MVQSLIYICEQQKAGGVLDNKYRRVKDIMVELMLIF